MSSDILEAATTITEAVRSYKALAGEIKSMQDRQKTLKDEIDATLRATGQDSLATSAGKVSYVQPGVTVSYKATALDVLCESSDEIKRLLAPHRTETQRAGYLLIK